MTATHSDVNHLPTPALMLNAPHIRRNIQKLANYASKVGVKIRPHIKTEISDVEEHGQIDVSPCDKKPIVGERVTLIPNHICPCVNLRVTVWWLEPGEALRQLAIDARGRIQ